jgi:hypothetical protein
LKSIVVNIHSTFVEVGGVEIAITVNKSTGMPGVTGTIGSLDYDDGVGGRSRGPAGSYADVWVPAGDGAVKGGKEKSAAAPAARTKSLGLESAIVPVGVPVGKVLLLGLAFGIVTTSGVIAPAPL